ncbi:MAG TPA: GntR family transcriptional regulator [Bacillales bacterium]|nr:GntR family transcriptional regulator [Bacillales bacterium]
MVDKASPLPIYFQLEEAIKTRIENGELAPGNMIPSEREFAERHQISRMTVRQAINNLVNDGYLYRQKGRGTFVAHKKIEQKLQGLTSFSEDMKARGMKPSSQLIRFKIVPASESIAQELGISPYDPVYEIQRVRLADDLPMALETTAIPANLVQGLTEEHARGSLYEYIEKAVASPIEYGKQIIESSVARQSESKFLDVKKGSPVLLIQRNTYLKDGTSLEVVRSVYRADRYKFVIDIQRIQK